VRLRAPPSVVLSTIATQIDLTVLQTSGSEISWQLVMLMGIAACVAIALAWLYVSNSSGGSD